MGFRRTGRGSPGHGVALFGGSLAVESASATNLQITTQPVGSTSPNLATQPVVAAKKSLGTTDTSYVTNVVPTLTVLTGSATLGGSEATGKACVAGVCTFTNLTVTAAAGATWTLTFTSGTLASAVSNTCTTTAVSNSAPNQPTLSAGTLTSSGATLTGTAFSDPDVGDTQAAAQWQVTTSSDTGYATPVISTGDDATHLTSYAATGLSASTAYIARVRYKDSAGNYSAYSSNASFTTSASGPTTLAADNFNRTSAGAIGTASDGGTWAGFTTFFSCNGTQLTGSTPNTYVTRDAGRSDYTVSVKLVDTNGCRAGLRWRGTDDSNHYALHNNDPTHFIIWKNVAGVVNFVTATPSNVIAVANGDTVAITVSGTTHTIKVNGTTVATFTDPDLPTGQNCGPDAPSITAAATWDDFVVTA